LVRIWGNYVLYNVLNREGGTLMYQPLLTMGLIAIAVLAIIIGLDYAVDELFNREKK